jgi:hypothetical protein
MYTIQNKNTIQTLAIIITSLVISTVASQSISTAFGASADVGFQDGLSDCQSGTSNAINGHSNAGHHSAAYMEAYNRGLTSCNNSAAGGSNSGNSNAGVTSTSSASSDWALTVKLIQTQFGTSSATVNLNGPFGYHDSQTTPTGPSPSVTFTVPGSQIPDGSKFQICVSSSIASTVFPNCEFFMHGSSDEVATMKIPG